MLQSDSRRRYRRLHNAWAWSGGAHARLPECAKSDVSDRTADRRRMGRRKRGYFPCSTFHSREGPRRSSSGNPRGYQRSRFQYSQPRKPPRPPKCADRSQPRNCRPPPARNDSRQHSKGRRGLRSRTRLSDLIFGFFAPVLSAGYHPGTRRRFPLPAPYNINMRHQRLLLGVWVLAAAGCHQHHLTDYRPLDQAGMFSSDIEQLKGLNISDQEIAQVVKLKHAGISDDTCVELVSTAHVRKHLFTSADSASNLA